MTFTVYDNAGNSASKDCDYDVNKKNLDVTADDFTITYGDADPVFTFDYDASDFVFSDDAGDIDTAPICSTAAPGPHNAAGSPYPISCSGGADDNYNLVYTDGSLTVNKKNLDVTAENVIVVLNGPMPFSYDFDYDASDFVFSDDAGDIDTAPTCASSQLVSTPVGSYAISCSGGSDDNYNLDYHAGWLYIQYASEGLCLGSAGHQILQPINFDGTSVFKKGSTIPAKFRVCDANGVSIGTPGVVTDFRVTGINGAPPAPVNETVIATTPDTAFRWSSTDQQWIFNINTKNLQAGYQYQYRITLNDGTPIYFTFTLK